MIGGLSNAPRVIVIARLLMVGALLGALALPPVEGGGSWWGASALAQDDGGDDDGDDGENGRGGDDGNDRGKDKNKDKGKDKGDDDDDDDDHDDDKVVVGVTVTHRMVVDCRFDQGAGQTTCVFVAVPEQGNKDVKRVGVPVAATCADVVGGAFELEHPEGGDDDGDADDDQDAPGRGEKRFGEAVYVSEGDDDALTLVFAGEVTTAGETTYWVRTGDAVHPVPGAGLRCPAPAPDRPDRVEAPVQLGLTDSRGGIRVVAFRCVQSAGAIAAEPAFDWYGECAWPASGLRFEVERVDAIGAGDLPVATTGADGVVQYGELEPGRYRLELEGVTWCHAESDSVNAQGEVVVKAGARATVWIFVCGGGGGTPAPK